MLERIAILGGGSWGMAVSHLLCQKGHPVVLWEYDKSDFKLLTDTRSNPKRLKSFRLNDTIEITGDLLEAVNDVSTVVLATPSQHLRSVLRGIATSLADVKCLINLAKGIENNTLMRGSEMIADETGFTPERIATLSGPSHAEEVILDMPTGVVAASTSETLAADVQGLFSVNNFRVYKSSDIIGVELGGSLKNVIAVAAGITDGLGLGDNTKGTLVTRGLAEITRLGIAAGAEAETFAGLSGVGDLVTTCFSGHSRNRYVGEQIGRGEKLDTILAGMSMVAEGVRTTKSAFELAAKYQVEVPIVEQVYRVLFEDKPADIAVGDLMERKLRTEIWR